MNNMDKKDIIQSRITNLINLRQIVSQALIVLIGGIIGLFFMPNHTAKYIAITLGLMYVPILMKDLFKINKELKEYLYHKEGDMP